jgi:hypothetical protein
MNTDSINDPSNDLNVNLNQSFVGFNKILANPFFRVIMNIKRENIL